MSGLLESASAILSLQEKRLEVAGQNIANINTAGYKSQIVFSELLSAGTMGHAAHSNAGDALNVLPVTRVANDLTPGKLTQTDNPLDFAISGVGFFQINTSGGIAYTRQGQFQRDANGRLVTSQGAALQAEGGGDLTVNSNTFTVAPDGTVTEDGRPTGRIGIYALGDSRGVQRLAGGIFKAAAANEADGARIRQGYLESSNVSTAFDMVTMLESVRLAQTAQRLVLTYDDMLGRALSTLGQMQ